MAKEKKKLFGSNVVEHLIPHRRPFLLVDSVLDYQLGDVNTIYASKYISASEPIFDGHFPDLHLWPGVYTIEGLGQASNILMVLDGLVSREQKAGGSGDGIRAALQRLESEFTLQGVAYPNDGTSILKTFESHKHIGVASGVNIKFLKPVLAGCRLDYCVTLTHRLENQLRFEVVAKVDNQVVAKGTMSAKIGFQLDL